MNRTTFLNKMKAEIAERFDEAAPILDILDPKLKFVFKMSLTDDINFRQYSQTKEGRFKLITDSETLKVLVEESVKYIKDGKVDSEALFRHTSEIKARAMERAYKRAEKLESIFEEDEEMQDLRVSLREMKDAVIKSCLLLSDNGGDRESLEQLVDILFDKLLEGKNFNDNTLFTKEEYEALMAEIWEKMLVLYKRLQDAKKAKRDQQENEPEKE